MQKKEALKIVLLITYFSFIMISLLADFHPGEQIAINYKDFTLDMLSILPCAFILIGLFEVWVKKETVEKHFGEESGVKGYLWALILAGTSVGGMYVAFPIAYTLYKKGAKLSIILTYVSASGICRIPMTIFEASFIGLKFTVIRFLVSLPLVIMSSVVLARFMEKRKLEITE